MLSGKIKYLFMRAAGLFLMGIFVGMQLSAAGMETIKPSKITSAVETELLGVNIYARPPDDLICKIAIDLV